MILISKDELVDRVVFLLMSMKHYASVSDDVAPAPEV
jgi:hypothetical protein